MSAILYCLLVHWPSWVDCYICYSEERRRTNGCSVNSLLTSVIKLTKRELFFASLNKSGIHVERVQACTLYSLTFCVRFLLPERHQWKPRIPDCRSNVENAPSRRAGRPPRLPYVARGFGGVTRRASPAGRSHYVVISRDGRKLGTRVRVMLP